MYKTTLLPGGKYVEFLEHWELGVIDMDDHTEIDRRNCRRVVPMKVLVLGLSRTGTESIRHALRMLGFNDVYHGYAAAFENPKDCEMWMAALTAKYDGIGKCFGRHEFDQLMGHCEAVSDIPAICFSPELIRAYPEAKVILTLRDVDEWHESVSTALLDNMFSFRARLTSFLALLFRSSNRHTRPMFVKAFMNFFDGNFEKHGKRIAHEHHDMVRASLLGHNLLEFRVQEGWGPLCKFLDLPVPEMRFPRGNDKVETTRRIRSLVHYEMRKALRNLLRVLVLLAVVSLLVAVKIVNIV